MTISLTTDEWQQVRLRSDVPVELVAATASDSDVVQAARVSVVGANEESDPDHNPARDAGLINYLLREKHGSPFEHNFFKFYVNCPIFVAREFMRHRIGFSYNELSGRYSKLKPDFWLPTDERPLINVGTSSKPKMAPGSTWQYNTVVKAVTRGAKVAWEEYEWMIRAGVANEVARAVLPVNIYTEFYVTCNSRSLMSFLSLRTHEPEAAHVSRPQREIEEVARQMEEHFACYMPKTYEAYVKNGRVAP